MFAEIPFSYRLIFLIGLMVVIAVADYLRHGKQSTKYKEYGFVLFTGLLGAMVGFVNDLITSSISPEYFILGKDLPAENIRMHAALFGLQVGFSGGAVAGAVCLFAARRRFRTGQVTYHKLLKRIMSVPVFAVLSGACLPLMVNSWDPFNLSADLKDLAAVEAIGNFVRVWWIHTGLYLGLAGGVIWLVAWINSDS